MLLRKVQKVKQARLITLPAQICDALGIDGGDRLNIELDGRKIIMEKKDSQGAEEWTQL